MAIPVAAAKVPWVSWACLVLAGVVILFPLAYAWSYVENYSFGWWVPPLAAFVFFERWSTRPAPEPTGHKPRWIRFILGWAVLFLFFRLALETSLSSRPLLFCCAALYVVAVIYWLWIYGGRAWARHFAFPVCFLLISVPWPAQIEMPIVQGLQQFNAWLVAHVLVLGGIYAESLGNVIVLANCTLGVEAACSGIRSLQAALMVAFLIGEFYRFAWPRRGKLVLLAIGLALLGNFLRAMILAVVASEYGGTTMSHWHDTAGISILIFTAVTTGLVAAGLNKIDPQFSFLPAAAASASSWNPRQAVVAQRMAVEFLACTVAVILLVNGWFSWGERHDSHLPTWTVAAPTTAKEVPIGEESYDLLKYDVGRGERWKDGQNWDWTSYWFRYHPRPTGETVFQTHNPDVCLPATGLVKVSDFAPFTTEVHGVQLHVFPKQFSWEDRPVYVFWVVYADRTSFPMEKAVTALDAGLWAKTKIYLSNLWHGRRASTSEMESLETVIVGPVNYQTAQTGYLAQLQKMIVPDAVCK
jgi:exosortase